MHACIVLWTSLFYIRYLPMVMKMKDYNLYHSDNLEQSGVSRTLNVQKVENSDLPPPTARLLSSRHI